jgi:hypothetical protein
MTYSRLRDAANIVAIAGGSGITPFLSLARAIDNGDESCSLTLLCGCRNSDEILFKAELDSLAAKNEKINVIYVLSHSDEEGYEKGFVGADIISKYAPEGKYSIFVCGPGGLYKFLETELPKLELERKYIRFEVFSSGKKAEEECCCECKCECECECEAAEAVEAAQGVLRREACQQQPLQKAPCRSTLVHRADARAHAVAEQHIVLAACAPKALAAVAVFCTQGVGAQAHLGLVPGQRRTDAPSQGIGEIPEVLCQKLVLLQQGTAVLPLLLPGGPE